MPEKTCGTIPGALQPVCRVIDNNQPGWHSIVETAPNVTLEVGAALYSAGDVWRSIGDLICERDELLLERNKLTEEVSLLKKLDLRYVVLAAGAIFGPFSTSGHAEMWAKTDAKGLECQVLPYRSLLSEEHGQ